MTNPFLACISQGQLSLLGDGGGQIVESPFGCSLRERAAQIYKRHAWKTEGRSAQNLARAFNVPADRDPGYFRISITSVSRGPSPDELLYTLETDEISGVFARDGEGVEKRLFHTADFRVRHLDAHRERREIAVSILHRDGSGNLAVLKADGSNLTEVTDGDSVDEAPRWVPGEGRRLVFQSSGMGRDRMGRLLRYAPYAIQLLDLDTGELSCLARSTDCDYLGPRIAGDGALYYIRRPNLSAPKPVSPWNAFERTLLLPFRILWAIFRLIDMSVERRTGSPIIRKQEAGEGPAGTPSTSVLMRQTETGPDAAETLAKGVRSFDFAGDGSILYSDGWDVYRMPPGGGAGRKVLSVENIEFLAAL